jgi:hypothetical protein
VASSFPGPIRDYNEETAFLVRLVSYHESPRSKEVLEQIARTQQDQACIFKATCAAALLGLLTSFLSQVYFFQSGPPIRLRIVCVLAIADLICVAAFATLFLIYCLKLNALRDECRQIIGDVAAKRLPESAALVVSPTSTADPAQMNLPFPN